MDTAFAPTRKGRTRISPTVTIDSAPRSRPVARNPSKRRVAVGLVASSPVRYDRTTDESISSFSPGSMTSSRVGPATSVPARPLGLDVLGGVAVEVPQRPGIARADPLEPDDIGIRRIDLDRE